jgi:hypothetical protein
VRIPVVVVCVAVLSGLLSSSPVAALQGGPTPTPADLSEFDSPVGGIIPDPNSGSAPTDPGDRGGVLQLTLLALIVGFGAVAVFSVRRAGRAGRATKQSVEVDDPDIDTASS